MSDETTIGYEELHWEKHGERWICVETGEVRSDTEMQDRLKMTWVKVTPHE